MSRVVGIVGVLLGLGLGLSSTVVAEDHTTSAAPAIERIAAAAKTEASGEEADVEIAHEAEVPEVRALAETHSRYQTWGRLRGRAANIELAASRIDGVTIPPGGVFSFNEVVGDRTREAGFRIAPVIRNGELDRGVGGGVCQVAGTLFGAAYRAGLDVLTHEHHTWPSTYVPRGLDATVAYGVADLELANPYDFPITFRLTTDHSRGRLDVVVEGAGEIPEIDIRANTVREMPAPVRVVQDPSLPAGETVVENEGRTGYWVRVTRTRDGREDAEAVHYPESERVVRVGTGG